jgi:hypothetical protein
MAIKGVRPIKEATFKMSGKPKRSIEPIEQVRLDIEKAFGKLGCPRCYSGLNRLILEDPLAARIR